jgi:D-alanine-D-alanine ligase
MKIALIYNLKKKILDKNKPDDFYSEFDSPKTVNSIAGALRARGHKVRLIEAEHNLLDYLFRNRKKVDFVFNIAEGINGAGRESQVPAMLDFLGIPYTGSNVLAMAVALDKAYTKKILASEGIPVPKFQLFSTGRERISPRLKFPLIVKPNSEGSAKGIYSSSVVYSKVNLYRQIERVIRDYRQRALVEEFIEGRELTSGVIGNGRLKVLPLLEIDFSSCRGSGEFFYSWRMKEFQGDKEKYLTPTFYCPARIKPGLARRISELALRSHKVISCWDISRTDFRLDKKNQPYVLEINPLPGLDPQESNFPLMARAAGIQYADLINQILDAAVERVNGEYKRIK